MPGEFIEHGRLLGFLSTYRLESEADEDYDPLEENLAVGPPAFDGCDEHQQWCYIEKDHPWTKENNS